MTFWRSMSGGTSWTSSLVLSTKSTGYAVAADPANTAVVYVGGVQSSDQAALFKSVDGGAKWTALGQGVVKGIVKKIAVHPTAPLCVFVGAADGLFRSTDGGQTWDKVITGEVREVLFDPQVAADIYAAGATGIWRSRDFGATWEAFAADLEFTNVNSLAIDWSRRIFYAGAAAGGLYRKNVSGTAYRYPPRNLQVTWKETHSVLQREYLGELTWEGDSRNTDLAKYRIYLLAENKRKLLAEVDGGTRRFWHRKISQGTTYVYAVMAVDRNGQEGGGALATLFF